MKLGAIRNDQGSSKGGGFVNVEDADELYPDGLLRLGPKG